jgi:hypothetical protein
MGRDLTREGEGRYPANFPKQLVIVSDLTLEFKQAHKLLTPITYLANRVHKNITTGGSPEEKVGVRNKRWTWVGIVSSQPFPKQT